jgi:hypothetical protein
MSGVGWGLDAPLTPSRGDDGALGPLGPGLGRGSPLKGRAEKEAELGRLRRQCIHKFCVNDR